MRNNHCAERQICRQYGHNHRRCAPCAFLHAIQRRSKRRRHADKHSKQRRSEQEPRKIAQCIAHRPQDRCNQPLPARLMRTVRRHAHMIARRKHGNQQSRADGQQQQECAQRSAALTCLFRFAAKFPRFFQQYACRTVHNSADHARLRRLHRRPQTLQRHHKEHRSCHHRRNVIIQTQSKQCCAAYDAHKSLRLSTRTAFAESITQHKREQCSSLCARIEPCSIKPVNTLNDIRQEHQRTGGKHKVYFQPQPRLQAQPSAQHMCADSQPADQMQRQQHRRMQPVVLQ